MYRTSKTLVEATTPSSLSKFTFAWQELRVHAQPPKVRPPAFLRSTHISVLLSRRMRESTATVVQGTCAASAASAFVTGLYGIVKGQPMYPWLAIAAAANTGITAGTFFGLREYIVAPLLVQTAPGVQYARRRRKLGLEPETEELPPLSRSELRTEKLLDSGLSGLTTGSLLQVLRSMYLIPGLITLS
ncbi:hypothetical protein BDQ17DRAFT_442287 [Cyathus striatus]|nr:hypothetical protein BDQ17DRAFT_442287 [Cyathus striatus]